MQPGMQPETQPGWRHGKPNVNRRAAQSGAVTRWFLYLISAITLLIIILAVVLLPPIMHWNQQAESWSTARSIPHEVTLSPQHILSGLPAYYKLNEHEARPATLQLILDEEDLRKLTERRNDALQTGWITSRHKEQLPAALIVEGQRMNASVRLRGNQLDHVSGDKWSFKVYLKQGARFDGMRRFSLQAPYTRSFQSEAIISDVMRSIGVLAPRIDYVDLIINDEHIGIMQITEEFDAPLLESQGRRFGPMLQLDDAHTWEMARTTERYANNNSQSNSGTRFDKEAWWKLFSTWQSATPKAYGNYSKRKKGEDLNAALSKWMEFTSDKVKPSEVFDVDAFVDFYIVCEYFSAHNLAQWFNLRLHYNTITARFEPIAYDADLSNKPLHNASLACLNPRNEFARTLMQDPEFANQWAKRIQQLDKELTSDEFADYINTLDGYYLSKLSADYPWLSEFDFNAAQYRCQHLCGLHSNDFAVPISGNALPKQNSIPLNEFPPLVKAYIGEDEKGRFLSLYNRVNTDIAIRNLAYENEITEQLVPLISANRTNHGKPGNNTAQLPVYLKPGQASTNGARIGLAGNTPTEEDSLSLQITVEGLGTQRSIVKPLTLPQHNEIPGSTPVEELLQRYSFLAVADAATGRNAVTELRVASGEWQIDELIIVPRNVNVVISEGTRLLFTHDAGIVLNGDFIVNGSAAAPVLFDAVDEASGWMGIFSQGVGSQLSIKHTTINATRGFEIPGWRQPAGILTHRANVELENVVVSNSCADDAINLIRSKVGIKQLQINNSCSDALDIDSSTGTLSGLDLSQSGGDLLDLSESAMSVSNSVFSGAGDKAISIGEASDAEISDVRISESAIGMAVKDLSNVTITTAEISAVEIGLMAFEKKAEYGPAFVVGSEIQIDAEQRYVLEEHSSIVIDDAALEVTPFDLSDFY